MFVVCGVAGADASGAQIRAAGIRHIAQIRSRPPGYVSLTMDSGTARRPAGRRARVAMDVGLHWYEDERTGRVNLADEWLQEHSLILARSYELAVGHSILPEIENDRAIMDDPLRLCKCLFLTPNAALLSHDVVFAAQYNAFQAAFGYKGGASESRGPAERLVRRDNMYNYSNRLALHTFERAWDSMGTVPSTLSADAKQDAQQARNELLGQALARGFVRFNVERVTATGKKVALRNGTLFNLQDEGGVYRGQAAIIGAADVELLGDPRQE
ncbi:hypothetical protein FVE85_7928 [Porphyridium purpureum]|uniref:MEKHLA domain-containing protein n=1 Tax=Porphyridium purpureum TaxID=35688 RepID=A0A5J4YLR1_PORPP|nr:hypothetical protein FVE85_7928 [Porphyridium purpureum]|eukprot:POR4280..scf295_9